MKFGGIVSKEWNKGRTPQGVRGLKSERIERLVQAGHVAPRKGCVD